MKYIKPNIEIIKVEMQSLMAASASTLYNSVGNGQGSKRNNYDPTDDWGDEDDEY